MGFGAIARQDYKGGVLDFSRYPLVGNWTSLITQEYCAVFQIDF